ncbi:AMP-binding protein [Colwellia sp. UCD-KL20]|uniref:AMP-binding protein n=1 Tax=Colwellia sp. UCD-KL20 TaxID=1917165 RepID=UPI0009711DD1|nr:AMP-binding protein [Colwellia sp. UCD-KL20]
MSIPFTQWPNDIAQHYIDSGYWINKPLTHIIQKQLSNNANKIALICNNRTFTYQDIDVLSNQLAAQLLMRNIDNDAIALVHLPNSAEFYIVFFTLLKCGIAPINALFNHSSYELLSFSQQVKPSLVILSSQHPLLANDDTQFINKIKSNCKQPQNILIVGDTPHKNTLAPIYWANENSAFIFGKHNQCKKVQEETTADKVAFFQLSGGSTGTPKLIPRTHNDYYYSVKQSAEICQLSNNTIYLCALPAPHNFTLSSPGALGVFYAGGTVVTAADPSPTICFPLIYQHNVTFTALVPPALHLWLNSIADRHNGHNQRQQLYTLKTIQVGGAKLSSAMAEKVNSELDCTLQQVFGMAEGLVNYTHYTDDIWHINNTQGKPMSPSDEIKIVDESGAPVAMGETGALWTRGPYTFRGYYNSPIANQRAFDKDGFYCTGDLVKQTPSGHLIVMGRNKDQINRGGEKIDAQEIEELLLHMPEIIDVALVAIPDDIMGECSCAFVVCDSLIKKKDIRRFLREHGVASFKIPDHITMVDTLPKTAVGKIDKRCLRNSLITESTC